MIQKDSFTNAQRMVAELLKKGKISAEENRTLYEMYLTSTNIQWLVGAILESYDIELIEHNKALYITPGVDNKIFGYKNEEIKQLLGVANNNEMYVCYFIIYCIIITFYKETTYFTYKDYITNVEVVERVDGTLRGIVSNEQEGNNQLGDDERSLMALREFWLNLDELPPNATEEQIHTTKKTETKYFYVNKTLNFLTSEDILIKNTLERTYMPTDKLRGLIADYFDRREVKNVLMNFAEFNDLSEVEQ